MAAIAIKKPLMESAEYARMDAVEERMWWYRALHARLFEALAGIEGRVLDAGCGHGGLLAFIDPRRKDLALVGLEWSEHAGRRAAAKSGASRGAGQRQCHALPGSCFDAVIAADVLCHQAVDPPAALAELRRVLRPGGRLVVNMPAYSWLMSAHDRRVHNARRQSAGELRSMLHSAGFGQIATRYWNGLLLPLMVVQRKLRMRHDSASDVAAFPPWLDAMLYGVTEVERRLLVAVPAGGSVLATAIRP